MKKESDSRQGLFLTTSLVLAVVLAVVGGQFWKTKTEVRDEGSAPVFRLATLEGRELGPSDFRGQVVLLDFWATWCIPCRFQEKILFEAHSELERMGVQVLEVNLGEEISTVRDHFSEGLPPWPVLLDTEDRLTAELGIEALPALMILGRDGEISYFDVGILDAEALRFKLELAGAP